MAEKTQTVPPAAIARLLNVPESQLDHLVKEKVIPKPVQGKYELINSVRGYIESLRRKSQAMDQVAVASHLDMSERNLRDVMKGLGIDWPADVNDIRVAYIRDLREKAAGRAGEAQQELTQARIRESRAKAQSAEISNLQALGALVVLEDIEPLLEQWATVSRAEVANALNKIVADIEGAHDIDIDQDMVNGHINSAYRIIGDYPGRDPASHRSDNAGDAEPGGEEMDTA